MVPQLVKKFPVNKNVEHFSYSVGKEQSPKSISLTSTLLLYCHLPPRSSKLLLSFWGFSYKLCMHFCFLLRVPYAPPSPCHFLKIHFNIIRPFTPRSSTWFLHSGFLAKILYVPLPTLYVLHTPSISFLVI
jgi:hypothetical protein